jgi:hypothetical protein
VVAQNGTQMNQLLLQYSYLQVLDFMTTVAFLLHGIHEGNPLVRVALQYAPNPLGGLLAVKVLAVALGIYCWKGGREKLLIKINLLFAAIVAWNMVALIVGSLKLNLS